ncbi:MAG: DUF2939 domain-containing protein [Phenylobacterium sp.]|uniref:DUF2939 domain-containing protein n=1 Tax=Phenylobacterium sp. TaxID=1871053 RepID=UPI0039197051
MKILARLGLIAGALLILGACATVDRYGAARDVHALLVSIRDDDRATFEAHVDRPALERQIEARLVAETRRRAGQDQGLNALGALLAQPLAQMASDALIQPRVFRAVAASYGYTPDKPIPGPLAIGGALRAVGKDQVCATRRKDGPCLLVFTRQDGVWRLSGFEGEISELRGGAR